MASRCRRLESPNYILQVDDDAWGYEADQVEIFKFHVEWTAPANSTFAGPTTIDLTSLGLGFDANMCAGVRSCIPQPGTTQGVDAISDRLMSRLAYRSFGDHESLVFNHTVDVNGADHAGIRWYELRAPGSDPTIHQAGTYAPDADHRFMGSIAMDASGNIALGYLVSSEATYPSVRYAGRLAGDPLGTLPQAEISLVAGTGSQARSAAGRGDHGTMKMDPADECTFWYTQEYVQAGGTASWRTRIGAFRFSSCTATSSGAGEGGVKENGLDGDGANRDGSGRARTDGAGLASGVAHRNPAAGEIGITLGWDANTEPDVAGYEVSYGIQSGVYSTIVDVGNVS